jgi:hypothetical protein
MSPSSTPHPLAHAASTDQVHTLHTEVLRKDRDAQGRSMLNGYLKGPQIGNGQHGKVFLAFNVNEGNKQVVRVSSALASTRLGAAMRAVS